MQPINHVQYNYFGALPKDVKAEIFRFLEKEDLGHLATLSKAWGSDEISNIMWKNLVATRLPEKFQKLPATLLKEKFKAYHQSLTDRITDILTNHQNYDAPNQYGRLEPIFSDYLITKLQGDAPIEEKTAAILKALHGPQLHVMADSCYRDVLREADIFLRLGVDPNFRVWNLTLLQIACRYDCLPLAKKLIEYGADVNVKDSEGHTPLDYLNPELFLVRNATLGEIEDFKQEVALLLEASK